MTQESIYTTKILNLVKTKTHTNKHTFIQPYDNLHYVIDKYF